MNIVLIIWKKKMVSNEKFELQNYRSQQKLQFCVSSSEFIWKNYELLKICRQGKNNFVKF
jgi:hypothetical protein